jgi:NitT/TauT family transport system ATP-binding protein
MSMAALGVTPQRGRGLPKDMAPAKRLIGIERVSKVYANGTVALSDVDLSVRQGEFVSLLGPSGCGKSTLLRLIAGLGQPSGGRIVWPLAGRDSVRAPPGELGFVFQDPTLLPWKTVRDNVFLPLKLAGRTRRETVERVDEALRMVGLEGFAGSYPRELSGGMKMRVSIARALVTHPRVLLMDEPFAALDEITRFKLNDDLLRLWEAQRWTVVFVTHSVFESVYLSSRLVIMSARPGRISSDLAIGAPYPRGEAFRTSTAYNEHCRCASAELHRAMGETPA